MIINFACKQQFDRKRALQQQLLDSVVIISPIRHGSGVSITIVIITVNIAVVGTGFMDHRSAFDGARTTENHFARVLVHMTPVEEYYFIIYTVKHR